ncbi:alpha/beta fold hydrolase [Candidatus Marinimicrobia bacterium]|nr:alpha/beta fold hydrolase [Candidatus Neomarinimicrobiota bacterium]|tara:strand:+ start:41 stop:826 length:786 start_codon:yes stop_codon:yes gene_type:complete
MKNNQTTNFDSNNYSYNSSSKLGIYLIHGFSSTTYEIKKIAKYLSDYGYYVKADNLPGHATSIEDCNATTHEEWLTFLEQQIAYMYTKCDKVIVIGVSMGGVLALHIATVFPLDGVIAASSLFKFKNEFNVRVLARLFHKFKRSIEKSSNFNPDQLKSINRTFYGYSEYPISALNEMRKLVDKVKPKLATIKSPVLLIHAKKDYTALFYNYKIIRDLLESDDITSLILDEAGHNIFDTETNDKKKIFVEVLQFSKRIFNDK